LVYLDITRPYPVIGILAGTLAGVFLGVLSGLFPGIHSNTLAASLLGMQAILLPLAGAEALAAAMFAALITHTFLDSIPSTFLGIPDPDTALSVLPAHMLCLEGKGQEAVRIAALGSAYAAALAIPLSILLFFLLPPLQPFFDWWIGIILIAVIGYLVIGSGSPGWALLIFGVSGLLGMFTFRYSFLGWHTVGDSGVLMPLLTGLFGVSVLLFSSAGPVPDQRFSTIRMSTEEMRRGTLTGTIAGIIVGWLPGLSNATANAVLCSRVDYLKDRRLYIFATNAANTSNAIIGLAALFALGRSRNGVMVALSSIKIPSMASLLFSGALAALMAYLITLWLSGHAYRLNGIDGRLLSVSVIVLVIVISILVAGPFGLYILILATGLGILPRLVNISRVFCMGAIMLPVIFYSFGIGGF
jgi:putative membrane protein